LSGPARQSDFAVSLCAEAERFSGAGKFRRTWRNYGLFAVEDRSHKIFSRKIGAAHQAVPFSLDSRRNAWIWLSGITAKSPDAVWNYASSEGIRPPVADAIRAATAFVNEDLEIIHTRET